MQGEGCNRRQVKAHREQLPAPVVQALDWGWQVEMRVMMKKRYQCPWLGVVAKNTLMGALVSFGVPMLPRKELELQWTVCDECTSIA